MNFIKRFITAVPVLIASLACANLASAYTLSLAPASGNPGETIGIDLSLQLDDGEELLAANFNVNFDSAVLEYTGVSWGSGVSDVDSYDATVHGAGVPPISFSISWLDLKTGPEEILLASIEFLIKPNATDQTTEVSFADYELYSDTDILDGSGTGTSVDVTTEVTPIPEPSSVLLLGLGASCLLVFRCRHKNI